jgi:hypothetical protein
MVGFWPQRVRIEKADHWEENMHAVVAQRKVVSQSAERERGQLHKFEARKSKCLLVERQGASTPRPRSELCDQRVPK